MEGDVSIIFFKRFHSKKNSGTMAFLIWGNKAAFLRSHQVCTLVQLANFAITLAKTNMKSKYFN